MAKAEDDTIQSMIESKNSRINIEAAWWMSINILLPVTFSRIGRPCPCRSALRCCLRRQQVMSSAASTSQVMHIPLRHRLWGWMLPTCMHMCYSMFKSSAAMQQDRSFGPHTIHGSEIFVETPLSFAFVNLKPVVPGET
jgi:hypothetical protein